MTTTTTPQRLAALPNHYYLAAHDGGTRSSSTIQARVEPLQTTTATTSSTTTTTMPMLLPLLDPPRSLPPANKGRLVEWYDQYLSIRQSQERKRIAEEFFQAAVHQASNPLWYGPGRIPRQFRNRHALLCLHIWMLHKRLVSDTYDAPRALAIQEELFNILWEDTMCRVRHEGVNEWSVNKTVQQVQQYSWIHLTHYDHVYTEFLQHPVARLQELKRLIARHILLDEGDIQASQAYYSEKQQPQQQQPSPPKAANKTHQVPSSPEEQSNNPLSNLDILAASKWQSQLHRLAWYIDVQYQNIVLDWPDADYRQGRVVWTNLPDFSQLVDRQGQPVPVQPLHPDDVLPEPWLKQLTLQGKVYYWNPILQQTSWERPGGSVGGGGGPGGKGGLSRKEKLFVSTYSTARAPSATTKKMDQGHETTTTAAA
ncbi:hypothetical protein ACA910_011631 [Epithemia clementina (nom. ined.)]